MPIRTIFDDFDDFVQGQMFRPRNALPGPGDVKPCREVKVVDVAASFVRQRGCEQVKDELVKLWRLKYPHFGEFVMVHEPAA